MTAVGPFESWEPLAGLALGLVAIVQGLLFRAGANRRGMAWYWDEDAPFYLRNLPFGLLPIGAMFLAGLLGGLLLGSDSRSTQSAGWACIALAAASAVVWLLFAYRPPSFAKPEWLRREEAVRGAPRPRRSRWAAFERAGLVVFVAVMLAGFVGAVWGAISTAS